MGSCAAPSAKGDDKFITTDYLQQCPFLYTLSVYLCHTPVLQKCYIHPVVIFILIHSFFYAACRKISV
ncbi:hypothetical protein BXP27_21575 [Salmonella enterica subsp. enterica serovar Typhimurium]|nr:hypothetical protein BXP27_21575 [Salmonella enterica subsp. enterica serovar Typhimurium]